jgi:hypothetical protein
MVVDYRVDHQMLGKGFLDSRFRGKDEAFHLMASSMKGLRCSDYLQPKGEKHELR